MPQLLLWSFLAMFPLLKRVVSAQAFFRCPSSGVTLLPQSFSQFVLRDNSSCSDFSVCYGGYKKAVELLATADCLLSLAEVAKMPGYVW